MFNESRDFLRRWGSLEGERLGDAGSEATLLGEVGGGLGSRGGGRDVCGSVLYAARGSELFGSGVLAS